MKYLLILFVIALALAPLSHFVPSKRQRRVARLRENAAINGLFVEFRDLPGKPAGQAAGRRGADQVIYYGKRLPPARGRARSRLAWLQADGEWRGAGHRQPLPELLRQLPVEVLAASIDEGSCGLYWREAGEDGVAEQVLAAVQALAVEVQGAQRGPAGGRDSSSTDDFS